MRGKSYRIPTSQFPSLKPITNIKIPQPVVRPFMLRPATAIKKEISGDDAWMIARRRRGQAEIGENQLELRAVSRSSVRGTLPERIVYKYLSTFIRCPFDFQSSLSGGRMETGGAVADFIIYPYEKGKEFVLNIDGPTHADFLRHAKDEEQEMMLESMGFKVYKVGEETVYDVYLFEEYMRRLFALAQGFGGGGGSFSAEEWRHDATELDGWQMDSIYENVVAINRQIDSLYMKV
jgi:hypothetical protein